MIDFFTKYTLRKLPSRYSPTGISKRSIAWVTLPFLYWFAGAVGMFLEIGMQNIATWDSECIDPYRVLKVIHSNRSSTINASSPQYSILVLEQWATKWL
jgi:hypothetical protein